METSYLGLDHPIWMGDRVYTRGIDTDHDRKLAIRRTKVATQRMMWAWNAEYALLAPVAREERSWRELQQSRTVVDNINHLTAMSTWDVKGMHNAHEVWYTSRMEYRADLTLAMIQVLNNIQFCRETGDLGALTKSGGFPLMNYEARVGPTYPLPDSMFGRRDQQIVVHDGGTLWYFEGGDYSTGHELIIDRVII